MNLLGHRFKIITSTGGKGGVGKSTFAILLALKFIDEGKRVVLCDADVECPNDSVLLGEPLQNSMSITQPRPRLIEDKCIKCGQCSEVCRENAIFWVKNQYPEFILDLCSGCGACWHVCPQDAIATEETEVGESFLNKIKENFWLITGRSHTGIPETGPIVREVKKRAISLGKEKDIDYLIIDTSPGTHCNVINALLGVDKAYAITEPTPLGAHDLKLILELSQKLEVPTEVVLNLADVGDRDQIEAIVNEFDTEISIEIPYSKKLVKAYANQQLETMVDLL